MYGAIIGDLAGSIYEYDQTKKIKKIKINKIIEPNSFISDDTILTIAILDAFLHDRNYEKYLKEYINRYKDYLPDFHPYFDTIFSKNMIKWANEDTEGRSIGNGAIMRISPIGFLAETEEEVKNETILATIPSHESKEAIDAATLVALIIFYFRKGLSKEEIIEKLNISLKYKAFDKFNKTCNETINNCLYVLFNSTSFDGAIKSTIMMGGDTDTNAAIVGSMAEAVYGIDDNLLRIALEKIPHEFRAVLREAEKRRIYLK